MTRRVQGKYPAEVRERTVHLLFEHLGEYPSEWASTRPNWSTTSDPGTGSKTSSSKPCSGSTDGTTGGSWAPPPPPRSGTSTTVRTRPPRRSDSKPRASTKPGELQNGTSLHQTQGGSQLISDDSPDVSLCRFHFGAAVVPPPVRAPPSSCWPNQPRRSASRVRARALSARCGVRDPHTTSRHAPQTPLRLWVEPQARRRQRLRGQRPHCTLSLDSHMPSPPREYCRIPPGRWATEGIVICAGDGQSQPSQ